MKKLLLTILLLPSIALANNWECINHNFGVTCNTWRWEVPEGWMVSTDNGDADIALVYVPDPEKKWKV